MRAPRFRLRTWMILVAVAGVALGGGRALWGRHLRFQELSRIYENEAWKRAVSSISHCRSTRQFGSRTLWFEAFAVPRECRFEYYGGCRSSTPTPRGCRGCPSLPIFR